MKLSVFAVTFFVAAFFPTSALFCKNKLKIGPAWALQFLDYVRGYVPFNP